MKYVCQGCATSCYVIYSSHDWGEKHEAETGHRVVLWDTNTSQLPRSYWTEMPAPQFDGERWLTSEGSA